MLEAENASRRCLRRFGRGVYKKGMFKNVLQRCMKVSCWKDEELGWFFLMIGGRRVELWRVFILDDECELSK